MKVTKEMLKKAHDKHFKTETYSSLMKAHALQYLYHKQRGEKKAMKQYDDKDVVAMAKKLEAKKQRKKSVRKAVRKKMTPETSWIAKETNISMY
jgi:hypothetical protein